LLFALRTLHPWYQQYSYIVRSAHTAPQYTASPDAGAAVLNTNICTATSLLVWTLLDYCYYKKPAILGSVQGMITGLVAITPAAGVIAGWAAIVMGVLSASIPWCTMNLLG
jgi:Amt family ammonium transporter